MSATTTGQSVTDTLISPFAGHTDEAAEGTLHRPVLDSPFAALLAGSPNPETEQVASFAESLYQEDSGGTLEQVIHDPLSEFEDEETTFEHEEGERFDSGPWTGSADQIAFRERVLAAHLAHRRKGRGSPLPDLSPEDEKRLVTVPGTKIKTFPATAAAAGRLLTAAHVDLAKDKDAGDVDALRTIALGVSSGYRSSRTQRDLWLRYFEDYYNQTRTERAKILAGPHSEKATEYMLEPGGFGLRGKIGAPGYSNHQNGIAVDFLQTRIVGHAIKNSSTRDWRKAWYASWFHRWLRNNAHLFGFQPIPTEEWHWEYRKGATSLDSVPESMEAFETPMDDSEECAAVSSPEFEFDYEDGEAAEPFGDAWSEADYEDESSPSWSLDEEDGAPQDFSASRLEWPRKSAEELKFMRAVYDRQVADSTGTYTADLPNVATIEGKHWARPDAAKAARGLLAQARADLAAEGLAGSVRLGIISAYRPASEQFVIWQGKGRSGGFPYYYQRMLDQGRLRRGDFGPTAVARMAAEMAKWIAAPGFSNHQDGLAIDFGTGDRRRDGLGKIGTRSWLHKWLSKNARRFGFHPYKTEAWHWTYRSTASSEAWSGEVTPGAISAGEIKVQDVPLLSEHNGTRPSYDLMLGWNAMSAMPEAIDVVVHLHGYWYPRPKLLDDIRPVSGLDLAPKQSAERRARPTLTVLPRGHDTGITQKWKQKDGTYKYGYNRFTFPRLVTKDGLTSLIRFALDRFAKQVGGPTPRVGRLILTAHSGGGAALLKILEHTDPHQVHVFDGLYQDASALARWARKRIERDRHALQASGTHSPDDYMGAQGGALRVFYQGGIRGGTRPHSLRLRDELATDLGAGLERWYRVEGSSYDHFAIPRNYGWRLLIDAKANLPKAQSEPGPTRAREGEHLENWDTEDDYEFDATENDLAQVEECDDGYEFDSGPAVDMLDDEQWASQCEIDTAAGESEAGVTEVPLGGLAVRTPARTWSYRFTPEDLVWTAKLLVHEAGGQDNVDNTAVLWAMFNRYALFTYDDYPTFSSFIRAYSTTLQPVLRNPQAAARHMHRPPSEFVRTGGSYPDTDIPRGQLRRHLDIQKAPWSAVKRSARQLATRALTGQLPNPGIGLATQFASTRIYFHQKQGRNPTVEEWRRYTADFAKTKDWKWIGDVVGLNQLKNAFFVQRPAAGLPVDAVRVLPPDAAGEALQDWGEWELEHEDAFEADEVFDGDAELKSLATAVTRALWTEWPAIREGLRRLRQPPGLTTDISN
ncbi:D-alanyl-D-alanine carboxypeptidase family protein [Mycobacterium sp. URHB0021]